MKEDESALNAIDMAILSADRRIRTMSRAAEINKKTAELRIKSPCMTEKDFNPTAKNQKKK